MRTQLAALVMVVLVACGDAQPSDTAESETEAGSPAAPSVAAGNVRPIELLEAFQAAGLAANNIEDRSDICAGELPCSAVAMTDEVSVYLWENTDDAASFTPFEPCSETEGQCHTSLGSYTLLIGDYTAPVSDPQPYIDVAKEVLGQQ